MSDEKYWVLMSRYVASSISVKEADDLLCWLDKDPNRMDMLKSFQDSWDKSKNYPESFKVDTNIAWRKLNATIIHTKNQQEIKGFDLFKWLIVSVCLLLIIVFGFEIVIAKPDLTLITSIFHRLFEIR